MKIMNRFSILALVAAGATLTGCNPDRVTYTDSERLMFADTLATYPVTEDNKPFGVTIGTNVRCDYDRTFGVEIVDKGSTAIENFHYRLESSSVTIKAGEASTEVRLISTFTNFEPTDSIGVILRLVAPEQLLWDTKSTQTKVVFMKCCPFDISEWTEDGGNFILYSSFPSSATGSIVKSLVKAEAMPDGERLLIKNMLGEPYDLKIRFITGNPLNPVVEVLPQKGFFATNYGDVYVTTDEATPNYYYTCQRFLKFNMVAYADNVGVFGSYTYMLEWITQKQADYYANNGLN